jgi:hypothetical protein
MRQPGKARRDRLADDMAIAAERHQSGRQQKFAGLDAGSIRGHAGDLDLDDLSLARRGVGQRDQIDLNDPAHRRERLGQHLLAILA